MRDASPQRQDRAWQPPIRAPPSNTFDTIARTAHGEATMLGELIGEANGTLTTTEVLSVGEGSPKLKLTLRGSGKAMGVGFTDLITHSLEARPGGVLYGDGETVWLTEDGEICTWKGFGIGKPTGVSGAATFAPAGSFETKSSKLASLNGITCIVEYELDENGNYHWIAYEWKHPSW